MKQLLGRLLSSWRSRRTRTKDSTPDHAPKPSPTSRVRILTREAWLREGERLFGPDKRHWVFLCPSCDQTQTVDDFLRHHIDPQGKVFHRCLGAFLAPDADDLRDTCPNPNSTSEILVLHGDVDIPVLPFGPPRGPRFTVR